MRSTLLAASALALFALPLFASAQSLEDPLMSGQEFSVSVSPQYPPPYGQAVLSVLSSALNLASATMVVTLGGKEIYRGAVQSVGVPLGRAGSVASVGVSILTSSGSFSQSASIQPQDVALVAEPVASAPPLYKGKPLVPQEGTVRVIAMANLAGENGKALNPTSLSYSWSVDDAQIANASGIGKTTIMVASPLQYRARSVSVEVASQDGSLVGGASISLSPEDPVLRLYANDPLLGIRYDHALSGSFSISGSEASLYAVPFSFPVNGGAPAIQWFLNGGSVQGGNSITLRPTGQGKGNASISAVASAGESARASADLSLIFGATSGNFFGL